MWARPLDTVESRRWIEGYERLTERAQALPETRLVYVADREADILELMQRAQHDASGRNRIDQAFTNVSALTWEDWTV